MTLEVKLEIWEITFLQDDKTRLVLFSKVIDMPEHNPGNLGGTMRLGIRRTVFKTENSILSKFLRLFVLRYWVSFALPLPPLRFPSRLPLTCLPLASCFPIPFPGRVDGTHVDAPSHLISMIPCPVGCLWFTHVPGHDLLLGEPWFQLGSFESLHYVETHSLFNCFMSDWL